MTAKKLESSQFTDAESIRQNIFALMYQASVGVLKGHHGDLYYDTNHLRSRNILHAYEDGYKIYWSVRELGTHIAFLNNPADRIWVNHFGDTDHYVVEIIKNNLGLYKIILSPI